MSGRIGTRLTSTSPVIFLLSFGIITTATASAAARPHPQSQGGRSREGFPQAIDIGCQTPVTRAIWQNCSIRARAVNPTSYFPTTAL